MHGSIRENDILLGEILAGAASLSAEVLVCVPFPYLAQVSERLIGSEIRIGAQNVSQFSSGAFTGEVSAAMLNDFGCRYVIVGHSERRALYGDRDDIVAAKCLAVISAGMSPILCVGETLSERESGKALAVVAAQLSSVIGLLGKDAFAKVVIAYEPVWAIGTGLTASPLQAQEVHAAIRQQISLLGVEVGQGLRVLYGGSVKPQNAVELFAQPDIDGGLIGGAALVAEDFLAICQAAS